MILFGSLPNACLHGTCCRDCQYYELSRHPSLGEGGKTYAKVVEA